MAAARKPAPRPVVRYRVTAPGPVSGGVCGVAFANGHAVAVDPPARVLDWFRAEPGYVVEQLDDPAAEPPAEVVPEASGDAEDVDDEAADEATDESEEGPEWL
jgi:hypothetical protein